jgi:SAM-dependent methyltransferase
MELAGLHSFAPILFDVGQPERLFHFVDDPCDLVVSNHFFEVIPTKRYGEHLLRLMARLLRTDGLAFLQIKYDDSTWSSRTRPWSSEPNPRDPTTYRIDEFWTIAARSGFRPEQIVLEPEQPLLQERRYAYFLLRKLA